MVTPVFNPLFFAKSGSDEYQIERSLRFNRADSAYLSRTPSISTNNRTWTWSAWVKLCGWSDRNGLIFSQDSGVNYTALFNKSSADSGAYTLEFRNVEGTVELRTTAVYRDPTAWYHIVLAVDTTQATSTNRVRLYVNGVEISFTSGSFPAQNADTYWNNTFVNRLGSQGAGTFSDIYMAEVHNIGGQQLTPSSFGETNATTGAWNPIPYSGSYGTNGFYLNFSDNSNTTAATLGKDYSGNGNNWTPNNFSVTAGSGNDSLTDTPTNYGSGTDTGGVMRGNYNDWSSIYKGSSVTLANGNLDISFSSDSNTVAVGTHPLSAGKWYWEVAITGSAGASGAYVSVARTSLNPIGHANQLGDFGADPAWSYKGFSGNKAALGTESAYGATYASGDIISVALDLTNGKIWWAKNGTWQASGDPAAGTNAAFTNLSGETVVAAYCANATAWSSSANFGQRAFAYTPPAGFLSLCTQNMAEGSITTSGTFTGNANADGPVVALNGVPTTMAINGNAVTFGTHADKLAMGFKLRTSSASYNAAGSNSYSVSATSSKFKYARAQANP